jgi:hypothetical protein
MMAGKAEGMVQRGSLQIRHPQIILFHLKKGFRRYQR